MDRRTHTEEKGKEKRREGSVAVTKRMRERSQLASVAEGNLIKRGKDRPRRSSVGCIATGPSTISKYKRPPERRNRNPQSYVHACSPASLTNAAAHTYRSCMVETKGERGREASKLLLPFTTDHSLALLDSRRSQKRARPSKALLEYGYKNVICSPN